MDKQAAKDFDVKHQLGLVANGMQSITDSKKKVEEIASRYLSKSPSAFYIGRGMDWSVIT